MPIEGREFWDLPYYTGESLLQLAEGCIEPRVELIQGLIAEKTATLVFAEDGVGKSVLLFQAACQASVGLPVYDFFEVERPVRVAWFQMERHPREIGERLNRFLQRFRPDFNNLVVTNKLQDRDLLSPESRQEMLTLIGRIVSETLGSVDLICFDPMYSMTSGDLSDSRVCNVLTRFSNEIQNRFKASTLFVSHANRGVKVYNQDTHEAKRLGHDLYGNRFLSAHFSGVFHVKRSTSGSGTDWECTKDSNQSLTERFRLEYDPDTWCSTIESGSIPPRLRIKQLLKAWESVGKEFTIDELTRSAKVSTALVYKVRCRELENGFIETGKFFGHKKLFKSRGL